MRKFLLPVFVGLCVLMIKLSLSSYSTGITGSSSAGCSCHNPSASAATLVTTTGFPTNYVNGQVYSITLSITNASKVGGGFNLAVSNGNLGGAISGQTAITGNAKEIYHIAPKSMVSGTVSWTFTWTAPTTGTAAVSVTYAGNAVDFMNGSFGDAWNVGTKNVGGPVTPLSVTATNTNIACNGGTANITCAGAGGTAPYQYSRNGGAYQSNALFTNNLAGSYTITVKDASNATASTVKNIIQPTALTVTPSSTNVLCNGQATGSASVSVSGGTPGYTYSWSPSGGASATANGLAAGVYTCTVTDNNACTKTQVITITQPPALSLSFTSLNVSCFGGSNGYATANVSGGTSNYNYSWSPSGGTNATSNLLPAGTYACTVTDAANCSIVGSVVITQPPLVNVTANANVTTTCSGAVVTLNGANSAANTDYTYTWTGGVSDNVPFIISSPTTYTVTGNNAITGCSDTGIISLSPLPSNSLALSSASNSLSSTGSVCNTAPQVNGSVQAHTTSSCNMMASLQTSASLGDVTTCVEVLANVPTLSGQPYIPRFYTITPQNQGQANVTLYFTHGDLLAYNNYITSNNSSFPLLNFPAGAPQNGNTVTNASITKVNGVLGIGSSTAFPVTLTYDASIPAWKTTFAVTSFSGFYLHASNTNNVPLNVELISFSGFEKNDQHVIQWEVAREEGVQAYTLEHSTDGNHFSEASTQQANQSMHYTWLNTAVSKGHNYYRLKVVYQDGSSHYAGKVFDMQYGTLRVDHYLDIYPNPVQAHILGYSYTSAVSGKIAIQVCDVTGKVIVSKAQGVKEGMNAAQIDVSSLSSGQYWLKAIDGKNQVSVKAFRIP